MTVYELIKELIDYPADAEVFAEVGSTRLRFDIGGVNSEYHGYPLPKDNRAVIVLDP
jgi:hypothetical protein